MLLSNECQAAALQLSAGESEHNSFLKPAEKFSFGTWRLLLPDQPLGHAHCWQSQQDNRGTTAIHYTALNILEDLLLHIQTHYIPHPTHQMLSG